MSISDAQFAQWMKRRGVERVLLLEQEYGDEVGGAHATGTLYYSCGGYDTDSHETPASTPYFDVIQAAGLRQSIDITGLGGKVQNDIPEVRLGNADGLLDTLFDAIIDGYEGRLYLGDRSWPRADFRLVGTQVAESKDFTDNVAVLKYRDRRLLLDREIKGDEVGGSGPNATKYLPLAWGSHFNMEPIVYDAATITYSTISNFVATTRIKDVREGGDSLRDSSSFNATSTTITVDAGTDVFTTRDGGGAPVAHGYNVGDVLFFELASSPIGVMPRYWDAFPGMDARPYKIRTVPTSSTFTFWDAAGVGTLDITGTTFDDGGDGALQLWRQRWLDADVGTTGRFQLSSEATARVTYDLYNPAVDRNAPYALASALISEFGNVAVDELDTAAFTAADTALDAKIDIGYANLAVKDRANLNAVLDELIAGVLFGWYGDNGLGVITCGLLDVSGIAAASVDHELGALEIDDGISIDTLPVTLGRANVKYNVNHTPQPDGLVDSVTDPDERALYAEPYGAIQRSTAPSGTAYSTNKPLYHKTMGEAAPEFALQMADYSYGTSNPAPLGDYADEIVADHAPHISVITVRVGIDKYDWQLGEIVELTYPRYGFDAGRNTRIVSREIDWIAETVTLGLLHQRTPTP